MTTAASRMPSGPLPELLSRYSVWPAGTLGQ